LLFVDGGPSTTGTVGKLRMKGREVFRHAVVNLAGVLNEVLEGAGLTAADVDWVVPHQANARILDATAKKLGLPPEKIVVTVDRHANTSAASVPLAFDTAVKDGRIKRDQGSHEIELRVSTMPTAFGEKAVLRIFDPDVLLKNVDELGFAAADRPKFKEFLGRTHGIILVTGPTGSGKTTTLYSVLKHLSKPELNIITIEDPIEMVQEEFNQVAVRPAIELTFANALRTVLRQDPDIIMVGEIRDQETAEHAVQAALTGHLVLSTLHTNDAPSAVTRLLDLGIPHFLILSTVIGIVMGAAP